ncbi:matrixin family metalloprotease [Holdemania filiformis]|uniref:matrixin family metalloprotease n=1 Tax=Holdemania filiformis TaxID=61171 RepID=UPI002674A2BB|nr:matrixin family metalloprotease [Holdemania filiformis]
MKLKFCKKLLTCAITFIGIFVVAQTVYAATATPTFGGKFEKGVGNVTIYIDGNSGAGYWETYMKGGANNWMYPGSGMSNPIYIQFVSSNYGSSIDFYAKKDSYWTNQESYGVLAETLFYRYGERIKPNPNNYTNWTFTEIYINDDNFRSPSFTNDQAQGTVIHEMGHAFGLAHNNSNVNSIMCQTSHSRAVQRVQQVDNDAVKSKYN